MELLNGYRMRLVLLGIVGAIALGCGSAKADFIFGEPKNLGPPLNTPHVDGSFRISPDGLESYVGSRRPGGLGDTDIWVSTRATTDDVWGEPVNLGPTVNSVDGEGVDCMSEDGLSLYFSSTRPGGEGGIDIWVTTRTTREDPWATPVNLGPRINSSDHDGGASMPMDGLSLYFSSNRPGGEGHFDIWVTTRKTKDDPWAEPVNLGPTVNTGYRESWQSISSDGLLLFFISGRPGGFGYDDIWLTMRKTTNDPWLEPVNLGPGINSSSNEHNAEVSADGSTLYFDSPRPGGVGDWDLWQVPIIPIVDFNGDGKVDCRDILIMMPYWYDDCAWCDIGPMPWGDGVVNIEDLKVLAGYIGEELNDPTLMAHWPLDEIQGTSAQESVSGRGDYVFGNPLWQPNSGVVNGAVQLDGVDDCIITGTKINAADGPFSAFAWVNGGAPGQVILAQSIAANWLFLDTEGTLMAELKCLSQNSDPLSSETVITDGQWHRIGLVWDGSHRTLYVDEAVVAEDTQNGLENSDHGLYIGVGKDYTPGTFFSGLIDDVRIYNRALKP